MLIVQVEVKVLPDSIEEFRQATIRNAMESVKEPGVARFDVLQQKDDGSRFILFEIYRSEDAPAEHKKTAHYQAWQKAVEPMMAEPRRSIKYASVFPGEGGWG